MVKKTTKHNIWEVWCEYAAESVYVAHKPTQAEVEQIHKENWPMTRPKLLVQKLQHVYTKSDQ
jgi:hypothetical protein